MAYIRNTGGERCYFGYYLSKSEALEAYSLGCEKLNIPDYNKIPIIGIRCGKL